MKDKDLRKRDKGMRKFPVGSLVLINVGVDFEPPFIAMIIGFKDDTGNDGSAIALVRKINEPEFLHSFSVGWMKRLYITIQNKDEVVCKIK
jgi:hypothetical protein